MPLWKNLKKSCKQDMSNKLKTLSANRLPYKLLNKFNHLTGIIELFYFFVCTYVFKCLLLLFNCDS